MKDPRNPDHWTNEEIEADAAGYRRAQEARREAEAAQQATDAERLDFEFFADTFVRAGGPRSGAADAWREEQNRRAAEAARTGDEQARRSQIVATMGAV